MASLGAWLDYLAGNRVPILMYHSISDTPNDQLAVPPKQFEQQIDWLINDSFKIISLEEAVRRMRRRPGLNLRKTVVLTFDDGYNDFLHNAAPILQKHCLPATIFIVMGRVGKLSTWDTSEVARKTLNWKEICQVKKLGFSIGSHSMTHPSLVALGQRTLLHEIGESLRMLKEIIGEQFCAFAYPFGQFSMREKEAVAKAGCHCALKNRGLWGNGYETDLYLLKRDIVSNSYSLTGSQRLVRGRQDWEYIRGHWRQLIRRFVIP